MSKAVAESLWVYLWNPPRSCTAERDERTRASGLRYLTSYVRHYACS